LPGRRDSGVQVAVPMADGEAYVMLPGFNERHQHCVLAGAGPRFSSTHRVVDATHASCRPALPGWCGRS